MKNQARPHAISSAPLLRGIPLFVGVSPGTLQALSSGSKTIRLGRGELVFRVRDCVKEFFFVKSGAVKRSMLSFDGQEKVLGLFHSGTSFGESDLFCASCYASYAETLEPTELIAVDGETFRRAVEIDAQLSSNLVRRLAEAQYDAEFDLATGFFLSGTQRVLSYLLREAHQDRQSAREALAQTLADQQVLTLSASKQLIASRIGITPETLSRAFRELIDDALISVEGRSLTLHHKRIAAHPISSSMANPVESARRVVSSTTQSVATSSKLQPRRRQGDIANAANSARSALSLLRSVNTAGRQRMLSQRMASSWLMVGKGLLPEKANATLKHSMHLFDHQLSELAGLAGSAANDEILQAHAELDHAWRPYKSLLGTTPCVSQAHSLYDLNEAVLTAAHNLTVACEKFAGGVAGAAAKYVNMAGRERMLSQRVTKFYLFRALGIRSEQCHHELEKAYQEFSSTLFTLKSVPNNTPLILTELKNVEKQWARMRLALSVLDDDSTNSATVKVVAASDRLLEKMETTIRLYEQLAA